MYWNNTVKQSYCFKNIDLYIIATETRTKATKILKISTSFDKGALMGAVPNATCKFRQLNWDIGSNLIMV